MIESMHCFISAEEWMKEQYRNCRKWFSFYITNFFSTVLFKYFSIAQPVKETYTDLV